MVACPTFRHRAALLVALLLPFAAQAQLSLRRGEREWVVESQAAPTWRLVLAASPQANDEHPGGGTVRALHIPADNQESVVGSQPGQFCCAGWGLDNLEWRYVENNKGVRAPLGTTAAIASLEVLRESPTEIALRVTGSWKNVPRFTREMRITPHGFRTRIEAEWDGPTDRRGMWWLISLFRSSWVEGGGVTVRDRDKEPVSLPVAKEGVFALPAGIAPPYEVAFPLKQGPSRELRLRVYQFGTDTAAGRRYELWPEEKGFVMFYPRWVDRNFEKRRYVFDYAWTIGAGGREGMNL